MRIDMVTLFPDMFAGPFGESITKRAVDKGILDIHFTNFRDYSFDKHRHVDDSPFGGGAGMVLKPEPLYRAVRDVLAKTPEHEGSRRVIIMDPSGPVFNQQKRSLRAAASSSSSAAITRALMNASTAWPTRPSPSAILC